MSTSLTTQKANMYRNTDIMKENVGFFCLNTELILSREQKQISVDTTSDYCAK